MNRDDRGFAVVVILVVTVFLIVLVFAAVKLIHKKDIKAPGQKNTSPAVSVSPNTASLTPPAAPTPNTPPQKYSTTENWQDVKMSAGDYQRKQDIQSMLFKITNYKINNHRYPADAATANTVQEKNPYVDPDTKQPYKLVDGTPALGEMQYKLATTCDSSNRTFEAASSENIYAFMVRLSEGSFICKSNIR